MAITSSRAILNIKEKDHFNREDDRIEFKLAEELSAKISKITLRPQTMSTAPAYSLRRLTSADKEPVIKFLQRYFFRDEPMNQAMKLLETPDSRCVELDEYASSTLDEGLSVAAVDANGDIVGASLNGIVTREAAADAVDKSDECPNPKFRPILKVLAYLEREAKIWEHVNPDCKKILEIRIASTHPAWRGRGLMKALCAESERICLVNGGCACRMDTTSAFSAKAAERLQYKKIFGKLYADIPGAPQPVAPHLEPRVYIKLLK